MNDIENLILHIKQNKCKTQDCKNEKKILFNMVDIYNKNNAREEMNKRNCSCYYEIKIDSEYNVKLQTIFYERGRF